MNTVNKPFRKKDAMQLVTGQPVYMDDLVPADCLIVKLLRSPHANAIVKSINTAVAKKVPGIEAIFTWEDVPQDARRYTQAGQTYPEASPYDRLLISRPAGIYSAGTAQYYVNIRGRMPGKNVVILGSGDIGLIMARRMVLEGAKVQCVAELRPQSGGLKRNIVQCLDDFNIPLYLNTTVAQIHGRDRVEGVTLTKVDDNGKPIPGSEWEVPCDTLLLSCGLIPENELTRGLGADMDGKTGGPVVGENLECSIPGVFACGNVLHVHELVDHVSAEAEKAGNYAVEYIRQKRG